VALGYIKALVDYIKPTDQSEEVMLAQPITTTTTLPEITTTVQEIVQPEIQTTTTSEQIVELELTTTVSTMPEPIEDRQTTQSPIIVEPVIPEFQTTVPQLNNTSQPNYGERTIDEVTARGDTLANLKKPHDP
jgi:hypothetical protein